MTTYVGAAGVAALAEKFRAVPAKSRRTVGTRLRAAAGPVLADAKGNASWSTRIPASLSLRNAFTGSNPGVYFVARAAVAPHARPYEGIEGNSTFRHPLNYPGQRGYVPQATRPFLRPAVLAGQTGLVEGVKRGIEDAIQI